METVFESRPPETHTPIRLPFHFEAESHLVFFGAMVCAVVCATWHRELGTRERVLRDARASWVVVDGAFRRLLDTALGLMDAASLRGVVNLDAAPLVPGAAPVKWRANALAPLLQTSFRHAAVNEADAPRVILYFDLFHPDLHAGERAALVAFERARRAAEAAFFTTGGA